MDFKEKFNTVMKYFQVITLIKKFKETLKNHSTLKKTNILKIILKSSNYKIHFWKWNTY